jgi:hypothetical protein
MSTRVLLLPELSEEDPTVEGEGSLDPLGLTQVADPLAELLLPGLRARMRRIRFVTASAVGALAASDLGDLLPADGQSTPSICFEWVVLEAFARRAGLDAPLEVSGVPGSAKTRSVILQGQRLTGRNYLKSPSVFGFTGVFLPLARHLQVLDADRAPGAETMTLVRAWEIDQGLEGFTDDLSGTTGGVLRRDLRRQIEGAMLTGHCTASPRSELWTKVAGSLHPTQPGSRERTVFTDWLLRDDEPVRSWLASTLNHLPSVEGLREQELVARLQAQGPPARVRDLLDAIDAYEHVCWWLDAAFRHLRHRSTLLGSKPLVLGDMKGDELLGEVCRRLPEAMGTAAKRLATVEPLVAERFDQRLGGFAVPQDEAELTGLLLTHHTEVQAGKAPRGKRSWFEEYGGGWVVRSLYRHSDPVDLSARQFLHPYRLVPLHQFMMDLSA